MLYQLSYTPARAPGGMIPDQLEMTSVLAAYWPLVSMRFMRCSANLAAVVSG